MFGHLEEQPSPQSLAGSTSPVPEPNDGQRGPREGIILFLFTVITLAASAYVLLHSEHKAVHDPVQKAARGDIQGLDADSLLREQNLRRALAKVADGKRPLISNVRVSATRVDLTVRDADGSRKLISIDPGLGVKESDFGVGEDPAVRASGINAAAPERMVRAVAERTRMSQSAVDYVALSFAGSGEHDWYMSLDQGPARVRQWIAAPDGSDLRKPGELSKKHRAENARIQRQAKNRARKLKRTLEQRSACLSKATDAIAAGRCIQRFPL